MKFQSLKVLIIQFINYRTFASQYLEIHVREITNN